MWAKVVGFVGSRKTRSAPFYGARSRFCAKFYGCLIDLDELDFIYLHVIRSQLEIYSHSTSRLCPLYLKKAIIYFTHPQKCFLSPGPFCGFRWGCGSHGGLEKEVGCRSYIIAIGKRDLGNRIIRIPHIRIWILHMRDSLTPLVPKPYQGHLLTVYVTNFLFPALVPRRPQKSPAIQAGLFFRNLVDPLRRPYAAE